MDYWKWLPGTSVLVLTGNHKAKTGIYIGHDPVKNKLLIQLKDSEEKFLFDPIELKYLGDQEESNESSKVDQDIDVNEDPEDLSEDSEEQVLEIHQKKQVIETEKARETLLRLASRKEGVTLEELSQERHVGEKKAIKGPYSRTIKSLHKQGAIEKKGHKRKGEDVYVTKEQKHIQEPQEIISQSVNSIASMSLDKDIKKEVGDLFIALGNLLKKI